MEGGVEENTGGRNWKSKVVGEPAHLCDTAS